MKKLIGLTGLSGSGKSMAAQILGELGCECFDCDETAHIITDEKETQKELMQAFGSEILIGGRIDRKALGKIVFSDNNKLLLLNRIMHKKVIERIDELYEKSESEICVVNGSELETCGFDEKCDAVIVITARDDIRLNRITSRDGIDRESALLRMNAQKPYSKKNAIFVENNSTEKELSDKLSTVYHDILLK